MTWPRFEHPEALWLLLLAGPIVWLGLRSLAALEPTRRIMAIALRLVVLVILVLMLGGLQMVQQHEDLTVMAIVDRSESVRRFAQLTDPADPVSRENISYDEWSSKWLRMAGQDRRTDDRFGMMRFDAAPWLSVMPSKQLRTESGVVEEPRDGTDLAGAMRTAMGMMPPDSGSRLVLISDGNHASSSSNLSDEEVLDAAREAKANGIPIDVVPIQYRARREVLVEAVYAPTQARQGRTVAVRVALRATTPTDGTLELYHDDQLLDVNGPSLPGSGIPIEASRWTVERDDITGESSANPSGEYVLVEQLDLPVALTGVNRFRAVFEPLRTAGAQGGDQLNTNNQAEGFTLVSGKGKVLFVDNIGGDSGNVLPSALAAHGIDLEVIPPQAMPYRLSDYQRYDAVVFQNVPADLVTVPQQQNLVRYVHDLGGGFLMVGGDDSFGAGAWTNSPIDQRILPVKCEIPAQTVLPTGALMLVIDRSGSMHSPVGNTNKSQIELAAEAAVLAMQTLYPQDYVGVVSFDSSAHLVAQLSPNSNPKALARKIRSIQAGGGTSITPGLEMAGRELGRLKTTDAAVRHVILITDGHTAPPPGGNWARPVGDLMRSGITVSTIGVGDGHNSHDLTLIARMGNGKYHAVTNPSTLPQVFIKEAKTIRKSLIKDQEFTPQLVQTGSPVTRGLQGVPDLKGLVLTGPRNDPRVFMPMLGPEGEPLFAHWQTGLGRAAAFTSDATNRWATAWLQWGGYVDFWGRTIRHIARPAPSTQSDLIAEVRGNRLHMRLDAASSDPSSGELGFDNFLNVRGAVIAPDGSVADVTLEQTGPGLYETDLPADMAGSYVISLMAVGPDGERNTIFGGANRPVGRELRQFRSNTALLEQVAEITGGRVLDPTYPEAEDRGLFSRAGYSFESRSVRPLWQQLLILLLIMVLLDVANRRIAWSPQGVVRGVVTRMDSILGTLGSRSRSKTWTSCPRAASCQTHHGFAQSGSSASTRPHEYEHKHTDRRSLDRCSDNQSQPNQTQDQAFT